jgi:predicted methyltransferase
VHDAASALLAARDRGEATAEVTLDFGATTRVLALADPLGVRFSRDDDPSSDDDPRDPSSDDPPRSSEDSSSDSAPPANSSSPRPLLASWDEIRDVAADERGVYALHPNAPPARVQAFSRLTSRFVSLAPSGAAFLAPTALVAGFSMHRFGVGVDPMEDTRKKIGAIAPVRPNAKILDVCTGLAYTACAASALGARVTTIELDPAMTEMCRANPRSRALFTGEIRQLYGDAAEVVKTLPDESFDRIVHDPPTFALAGQLFGGEFYAELLRVLKTKGTMYHYVGDPASRSAGNVARGAVGRLKRAGFADAVIDYDAHGIVAVKTGRVRLTKSNERGRRRRRDGSEEDDGRAGSGGGRGVGRKGRAKGRAAARGGGDGARRDGARRGRGRRGDARGDPRRGRDEGDDATLKNEFF